MDLIEDNLNTVDSGSLPSISIVIPVYNSETILPELIYRLSEVLPAVSKQFEAILINDGSQDKSWEVVCNLYKMYKWVHGINLMRNYGQHNALLCGIRMAENEVIITMDDHLQHPPEEIPKLLCELDKGHDVVYGTPQKEQHGLWRDLASQLIKMAMKSAMGIDMARNVSAFRAFRVHLRDAFSGYQSPFVSIDVLLTWGTTNFTAIPVRHDPRRSGTSNYNFTKLTRHVINMMTGFSTLPLRLASLVGFGFTMFGLVILIYVVGVYLIQGESVPGFPFLASIVAIFSGAQLFALGIIGEYLARMHFK